MSVHEDKDLKSEFQIERVALFSDAVFAIAITLLVIELKVPELTKPITDHHLLEVMAEGLFAKFIGFIVSFMVIAMYLANHHLLFGYLSGTNRRLIWVNIHFLFTIVLMPFSAAFYSEYWMTPLVTPVAIYAINLTLSGVTMIRLWNVASNPKYQLYHSLPTPEKIRFHKMRTLIAPAGFLLSLIVAFFDPLLAWYVPLIIPVVITIIRLYYRKRSPAVLTS
jgi:uncharacterized membrane protein